MVPSALCHDKHDVGHNECIKVPCALADRMSCGQMKDKVSMLTCLCYLCEELSAFAEVHGMQWAHVTIKLAQRRTRTSLLKVAVVCYGSNNTCR